MVIFLHPGPALVANWTEEPGSEIYYRFIIFTGQKSQGESMENWSHVPLEEWTILKGLI